MAQLDDIQSWLELAPRVNWCATALATRCGVSARTLERLFQKKHGIAPKLWMREQRQHHARELLSRPGATIKAVSIQLGYKQPHHFSQEFKKVWGICPTQFKNAVADISLPQKQP